jgi:hypothetical protein
MLVSPLGVAECGGAPAQPDASMDATTMDAADEDVVEAAVDVWVDAPPERAIWVASQTTLFKFDPLTRIVTRVADFDCSGEAMVDLAMNAKEELFGITSESVVRIDKTTGVCTVLARGALDNPYATAFVPAASLEAGTETWLGYKYQSYYAVDSDSGATTFAGAFGNKAGNSQASGDMVTIPGGRTYLTAFTLDPNSGDLVVEIDPNTGAATKVDTATGLSSLVGMAQWAGFLYIFSESGTIYRAQILGDSGVSLQSLSITFDWGDAGTVTVDAAADASDAAVEATTTPQRPSWRGAAVTTRAPGM